MVKFVNGFYGPHTRGSAFVFSLVTVLIFAWSPAQAQEKGKVAEKPMAAKKADKTGTNPINFTHDLRLYNEYIWLNTQGDAY